MDENTTFDSSDFRNNLPRFTPEARKANQVLVDLLRKIAERKNATPAQIALAWLLAQKPWIVPIPGTTKLHRLDENLGAAAVELTLDDLGEIENAASNIAVQGDRYPEEHGANDGSLSKSKHGVTGSDHTANRWNRRYEMSESKEQTTAQKLVGDFAPKLAELTDDVLFGDVWERADLSKRDRSLVTVAALIANGNTEQLTGH